MTTDQSQRGSEPSTEPPSPQPNPVHPDRRPMVDGLGVALVALGTLAGAWYGSQTAEAGDVLVLRADKDAGQGLSLEDLRGVPVAVGQPVTGNLPAGTILTQDMISEGVDLPIGTSLVGVALTPAQMPATGLRPGDEVTLVVGTIAAPPVVATTAATEDVHVQSGDTLWDLAEQHLGDGARYPEIAAANPDLIQDPDVIQAGWELQIPTDAQSQTGSTKRTVQVRPGDTLWDLAEQHLGDGARYPEIAAANPDLIQDPDVIQAGWDLAVPQAERTEPPTRPTVGPGPALAYVQAAVDPQPATPAVEPTAPADPADQAPPVTVPVPAAADTVQDEAPVSARGPIGIGALGAAGVLGLLAARRTAQSRRRRPGRRIAMPTGTAATLEASLRTTSDALAAEDLDRALRTLAARSSNTGEPMPAIRAARITRGELELYLVEEASSLPAPFTATEDPGTWVLNRAGLTGLLGVQEAGEVPAPCPSLVTLGQDEMGGWVLVNLEEVGPLGIVGNGEDCQAALAALALDLVGSCWADDLRLTLVAVMPDLAGALGSDRVEYVPTLDLVLAGLLHASGHASVGTARGAMVATETWTPHLLMLAAEPTEDQRRELVKILASVPRLAVIFTTATDPLSDWVLRLTGRNQAVLEPAGITLAPQLVRAPEYDALIEAFTTTEAEDRVGPEWAATISTTEPALDELHQAVHAAAAIRPEDQEAQVCEAVAVHPLQHGGPLVRLLGAVEVQRAEGKKPQSPGRATELLAFLALHPSDSHEPLDAAMWPGKRVDAPRRNTPVSQARTWLGTASGGRPYVALVDEGGYRLEGATTDWAMFTDLVGDDIAATPTGNLHAALRLVKGQPLTGVSRRYYIWAEVDRQDMIAAIADIAHELSTRALAAGDARTAVWSSAKGTLVEPASELLWRDQLRAAWLSAIPGRVSEIAQQMTETLKDIGGDMEPETIELLELLTDRHPRRSIA